MRSFGQYDNYQFTKDKIATVVEFQPVFHGKSMILVFTNLTYE